MRAWAVGRRLSGDAVVVVGDLVLVADQGSARANEQLARHAFEDASRARISRAAPMTSPRHIRAARM